MRLMDILEEVEMLSEKKGEKKQASQIRNEKLKKRFAIMKALTHGKERVTKIDWKKIEGSDKQIVDVRNELLKGLIQGKGLQTVKKLAGSPKKKDYVMSILATLILGHSLPSDSFDKKVKKFEMAAKKALKGKAEQVSKIVDEFGDDIKASIELISK